MRSILLAGACCLALAACSMEDPCPPRGAACGGDPTGQWSVVDSCRAPAYQNPEAVTYYGQTQTTARQPPPEPTSSDWCSYLVIDPMMDENLYIKRFVFPHDTLAVVGGDVTYDGAGLYGVLLQTDGKGAVDLSASCLTRFAATFQCAAADPATLPPGVRSLANDLTTYSVTQGSSAENIVCNDDGNQGCYCTYDLFSAPTGGGLSGRWSTQGPLLTHFAGNQLLPSQVDLCVSGNTMTLQGHNRADVWEQAGLRTVTLMKAN